MRMSDKEKIGPGGDSGRAGRPGALPARARLPLLAAAALVLGQMPLLGHLLSWQAAFFHEISHGLAAAAGGGRVLQIELHFAGSGLCQTSGGVGWLTSLAGYPGAALWGLVIYLGAGALSKKHSHLLAVLLAAALVVFGLLFGRDFQTWAILLISGLIYAAAICFRDKLPLKIFLKVAGLYLILDAVKAPLALLGRQGPHDAAALAGLTGFPEVFWIIIWLAAAGGCLAFIWKIESRAARPEAASAAG